MRIETKAVGTAGTLAGQQEEETARHHSVMPAGPQQRRAMHAVVLRGRGAIGSVSSEMGTLVTAAATAYDREQLLNAAEALARRHGFVRLEIGPSSWVVCSGVAHVSCGRCAETIGTVQYHRDAQTICAPCVRRSLRQEATA